MKGRRYPLGIQTFKNVIEGNYIYVDKTDLIYQLANESKYCFLSRPRRFGKSLLVTTLQAYFEGKKDLFKGLAIDDLETEWTAYPVIHFDLSRNKYYCIENLHSTLNMMISDYEKVYHLESNPNVSYSDRLNNVIEAAVEQTGRKVVILIDEYDSPMHDSMKDEKLQDEIRNIMRGFFSPLKAEEDNLRFVFMTGISKFSQLSIFSELNNITNISMDDEYSSICGISRSLRTDVADAQAGCTARESTIGDEGALLAEMTALDVGCWVEHLLHTRTALRPLVGDDHAVARVNLAAENSLASVLLGVEANGWTLEVPKHWVYARSLHHTTILGDVAEEHCQATILGVSMLQVADTALLAVGVETLPLGILATHLGRELSAWG